MLKNVETFLRFPLSETILSALIGSILLIFDKKQYAEMAFILGPLVSTARWAFTKTLEDKMKTVDRIASIIDLENTMPLDKFNDIVKLFYQIKESEFGPVKESIVSEAFERLRKLAQEKKSDPLTTSDYYTWLLRILEDVRPGSSIWAISMMLECEWDGSVVEERFLELNMLAAKSGVHVRRIFIVKASQKASFANNPGVAAHLQNYDRKFLNAMVIEYETLARLDHNLLKKVGDGFLAFDERVALIDEVAPEGGLRGSVVMMPSEILQLKRIFDSLAIHCVTLPAYIKQMNGTQKLLAAPIPVPLLDNK